MSEKNYVTYEEFGARGDGVTDDMEAIVACHAYANQHDLPVRATDGAQYYIGGRDLCAYIKTDVDWGTARFTIDDRSLENISQVCFRVVGNDEWHAVTPPLLSSLQKSVDFPHTGSVLLSVCNEQKRVYIRKGLNANDGCAMSDICVVDADGRITGDINWSYDAYTSAKMISVDDRPITIRGGIFTTVANQQPSFYRYHNRNICISRSHVTLTGLTHYVIGEVEHGAPYNGFLSVNEAFDVCIEHCLLTPHKTYRTPSKIPGQDVAMGSYDLILFKAVNVRLFDIRQTIDITDRRYWGLMGSNFCKNFSMAGCVMSRFDAHMGVTNGEIRDCTLGYMGANLIGFGSFLIENTTFRCGSVVNLREDYGSFFHGSLTLKNCTWIPTGSLGEVPCVIRAHNDGNHDFGYECAMPQTLEIDHLLIADDAVPDSVKRYAVLPVYDGDFSVGKPYPYGTPHAIRINVCAASGREILSAVDTALYPHLSLQ